MSRVQTLLSQNMLRHYTQVQVRLTYDGVSMRTFAFCLYVNGEELNWNKGTIT